MDALHAADRARAFVATGTRRTTLGLAAASLLGALGWDEIEAKKGKDKNKKKCKKKCGPCKTCKKGKCKPVAAGTPCGEGQQCFANGECVACDVCADGCRHSSLQAAIDAGYFSRPAQICPGRYPVQLQVDNLVAKFQGAGSGKGGTILDGEGLGTPFGVLNSVLEARHLSITGGAGSSGGGGISASDSVITLEDVQLTENHATGIGGGIFAHACVTTLIDCRVSANSAHQGGGIYVEEGELTLKAGSLVTGNTATIPGGGGDGKGAGGGIFNGAGTVTLLEGSKVTGNSPDDCFGAAC
jgi:predicted outer membrane repeat protein